MLLELLSLRHGSDSRGDSAIRTVRMTQRHLWLHQAEELSDYDNAGFEEVPGTDGGLLKKILTEGSGDDTPIKVVVHPTRSSAINS